MSSGVKQWLKLCGYGVVGVAALFGLTGDLGLHESSFVAIAIVGVVLGTAAYVGTKLTGWGARAGTPE